MDRKKCMWVPSQDSFSMKTPQVPTVVAGSGYRCYNLNQWKNCICSGRLSYIALVLSWEWQVLMRCKGLIHVAVVWIWMLWVTRDLYELTTLMKHSDYNESVCWHLSEQDSFLLRFYLPLEHRSLVWVGDISILLVVNVTCYLLRPRC